MFNISILLEMLFNIHYSSTMKEFIFLPWLSFIPTAYRLSPCDIWKINVNMLSNQMGYGERVAWVVSDLMLLSRWRPGAARFMTSRQKLSPWGPLVINKCENTSRITNLFGDIYWAKMLSSNTCDGSSMLTEGCWNITNRYFWPEIQKLL